MNVTAILSVLVCLIGILLYVLSHRHAVRQFGIAMLCASMLTILLSLMRGAP